MKNPPFFLKVISLTSLASAIIGIVITFKFPGTLAMAPFLFAIIFALWSIYLVVKNKYKCFAGIFALVIAIVGIILVLFVQPNKVEVVKDTQQEEITNKTDDEIQESDELNDALEELE